MSKPSLNRLAEFCQERSEPCLGSKGLLPLIRQLLPLLRGATSVLWKVQVKHPEIGSGVTLGAQILKGGIERGAATNDESRGHVFAKAPDLLGIVVDYAQHPLSWFH
jgi:hypothetical protein